IKDGIIKDGVVYEKVDGDCDTCDFADDLSYEMCGTCNHWDYNTCFKKVDLKDITENTSHNKEREELAKIEKKLVGKSISHFYYFYGDYKMWTRHIKTLTLDEDNPDFAIVNGDKEDGSVSLRILRELTEGKNHVYEASDGKFIVRYEIAEHKEE
ncbi:MAG: hypothetical protein LUD72_05385, partial [Bacteroidales bacterium]|nr:hypothetical protein [Bacteroidales bacterium]